MSENSSEKNENIVYQPDIKEKKVSFVWIIPVIILCVLGWVAYDSYMKKGTNIQINFKSSDGIKVNETPLVYKGVQLGKVTSVNVAKDLQSVDVNILVKSDVAKYVAIDNSRFWIKKPRVSLSGVSGLNTLVSGYKIELSPKVVNTDVNTDDLTEKTYFKGLEAQPEDDLPKDGYYVTLMSNDGDNVEVGTPVFYNKFQIGEIVSKDLKDSDVFIKVYIYDKFNYLVNSSSKFILNSALKVRYGASGLKVDMSSVYSAIVGGVTVLTPDINAKKITNDDLKVLYLNKEAIKEKEFFYLTFKNLDGIGVDTSIIYKGVEVGKISNVKLKKDDILVQAFMYDKYKYLLSENSEFFVVKPEVSLEDGVKNLGNVVKGNYISLNYKKGKFSNSFIIINPKDIKIHKDDVVLTLSSKNLNSISKKSKVYYKNIEVGQVIDYSLSKDLQKVDIKIAINKQYKDILNDHILFYDMSSKLVELKALDLKVNFSGIQPLLDGGIALVGEKRKGKLTKKEFKLYSTYKDVQNLKRVYNSGFTINAYFNNDFEIKPNMSIVYKNQEIGFVKSIKFDDTKSKAKLFIYNSFKKYINKRSRFYKKGIINFNASLSGVLFEVDNFTSLLEGSIHLDANSNLIYNKYEIFSSFDDMKNSSNSITILFDDVDGLQKDFSKLTYKGVNIGKVTNIKLNPNHKVEVTALIYDDYDTFSKKGTMFFLKKPRISLQEMANVGSAFTAVNIGVIRGKGKVHKDRFVGYNSQPSLYKSRFGTIVKVEDSTASSVNVDSPVYYKNVQIGKVLKIDLSTDASKVIIDCLIWDKYAKFIRTNSQFYDISGFEMKFSILDGAKVESNTFTSLLKGGIVVVTPYDYNDIAKPNQRFKLHKELREDWKTISPSIKWDDGSK